MEKLRWKVKHAGSFEKQYDFLETILLDSGLEGG